MLMKIDPLSANPVQSQQPATQKLQRPFWIADALKDTTNPKVMLEKNAWNARMELIVTEIDILQSPGSTFGHLRKNGCLLKSPNTSSVITGVFGIRVEDFQN